MILKRKKLLLAAFDETSRETCATIIIIIDHYQWPGDGNVCFTSAHHNYLII